MKGFPAWPGVISMPTDNMKRPAVKSAMHCVRFFGTNDFAWIQEHDIKPYAEFRDKLLGTKKKSKAMIKAVQEIEAHLKSKGTNLPELPNIPAPSDLNDSKAGGGDTDDPDEADAEFDALLRCVQTNSFLYFCFSTDFILDISTQKYRVRSLTFWKKVDPRRLRNRVFLGKFKPNLLHRRQNP